MYKDYRILWDVNHFDWKEVTKRLHTKVYEDDKEYELNYNINRTPFVMLSLIVDLNKRVAELEYQVKCLEEGERVK